MKHILGMAKSHLDLRGAKGPKLELDLLRLVYAVKELRSRGQEAQGYLLVMTPAIEERAKNWLGDKKYQAGDTVEILLAALSIDEFGSLQDEKKRNVAGMIAGSTGEPVGDKSSAKRGRCLGEKALRDQIMRLEPGVSGVMEESNFPFWIRWDFYEKIGGPDESED